MSVLDRIHRTETDSTGIEESESDHLSLDKSGIRTEADNPTIRRLRIVCSQLLEFATKSKASKYSRYAWVLESMLDEVLSELDDGKDINMIGAWFEQFGRVIQWTGSGDETVLPDSVRIFLEANHPEELKLAIEAPVA